MHDLVPVFKDRFSSNISVVKHEYCIGDESLVNYYLLIEKHSSLDFAGNLRN